MKNVLLSGGIYHPFDETSEALAALYRELGVDSVVTEDVGEAVSELETAVLEGLGRSPKAIPPKFFYDRRGSELFDAICAQPEYYLPAAEREILQTRAAAIATRTGSGCVLIEPGDVSFLADDGPRNHFRLGFSSIPVDRIEPGIERLAARIDELAPGRRRPVR